MTHYTSTRAKQRATVSVKMDLSMGVPVHTSMYAYTMKNHYRKGDLVIIGLYCKVPFLLYVCTRVQYYIQDRTGRLVSSIFTDIPSYIHII